MGLIAVSGEDVIKNIFKIIKIKYNILINIYKG